MGMSMDALWANLKAVDEKVDALTERVAAIDEAGENLHALCRELGGRVEELEKETTNSAGGSSELVDGREVCEWRRFSDGSMLYGCMSGGCSAHHDAPQVCPACRLPVKVVEDKPEKRGLLRFEVWMKRNGELRQTRWRTSDIRDDDEPLALLIEELPEGDETDILDDDRCTISVGSVAPVQLADPARLRETLKALEGE